MNRSSILGGLIWCGLLAGTLVDKLAFAWIELLFLFAPLVIVPLGLELTGLMEQGIAPSWPERIARTIQLPAALLAVASFFCERGAVAASLAAGVCRGPRHADSSFCLPRRHLPWPVRFARLAGVTRRRPRLGVFSGLFGLGTS